MKFRVHQPFRWVASAAIVLVALAGTTAFVLANLGASTFEGNDGNLIVNTGGDTDWATVAGRAGGIDQPSGTSDNSFGQGTKEDDPNVSVVSGSIPPNKSDLTRFYEASETIGTDTYLYLAWERSNVLGSANMDFEINQTTTPTLGDPGKHTINRTAGDLLVTYDFTNGGSRPTLGLNRWLISATNPVVSGFAMNICFSANSFPCWGDNIVLNSTNSEGAINTSTNNPPDGTVVDPIAPNAPRSLAAFTFGEAAINLSGSGVFSGGGCKAFGSTFMKSRSSASFTAEVKDFVAPVPVNISNCGRIVIRKVTVPNPDPTNSSFSYSTTGALSPGSFTLKNGENQDYGSNLAVGSYSVTEANPGPNFVLTSLDCSASDLSHGSTATVSSATVTISLKADDTVDCTYTNTLQRGAIKITKTSSKGTHPTLPLATFSITGPNSYSNTVTTGTDGTVCVDQLPFGTYSVQETAAPSGYAIDDMTAHNVPVNANSTCGDGHEAPFAATDTPLSKITISFQSLAGPGVTTATIDCGSGFVALPESTPHVSTNLPPGDYTCTVRVDP